MHRHLVQRPLASVRDVHSKPLCGGRRRRGDRTGHERRQHRHIGFEQRGPFEQCVDLEHLEGAGAGLQRREFPGQKAKMFDLAECVAKRVGSPAILGQPDDTGARQAHQRDDGLRVDAQHLHVDDRHCRRFANG